jgi:hypothetical protein
MFEKLICYLFSQLSTQYAVTLCLLLTLSKSGLCSIDSPPSRILITVAVKNAAGVDYFTLKVPCRWKQKLR